jgi:hypothetical protein
MNRPTLYIVAALLAVPAVVPSEATADAVTDWNVRANEVLVEAKLGTPPAMRAMAIVQTAVLEAVQAAPAASGDAAVAAATRATLLKLVPAQQALIDRGYQAAVAAIPEGARAAGIQAGEKAAAAVLAARSDDGASQPVAYRPHAAAGAYVPTAMPALPHYATRKPWLMSGPAQFRPAPPPALDSAAWVREYNEVKAIGAKNSTVRTPEQTDIAQFWDYSLPPIYHGVLRSVAAQPGRDLVQNARLFAAATQALDDAIIAVWDAKYHYNFWRPITAVRNADLGNAPAVALVTTSPTAKNAARRWTSVDAFVKEVSESRIHAGIHFRSAVQVGNDMGKRIGALAVQKHMAQYLAVAEQY